MIAPFPAEVDLGQFCASFGGTEPSGCYEPARCVAEQRVVGQVSVNVFF